MDENPYEAPREAGLTGQRHTSGRWFGFATLLMCMAALAGLLLPAIFPGRAQPPGLSPSEAFQQWAAMCVMYAMIAVAGVMVLICVIRRLRQ